MNGTRTDSPASAQPQVCYAAQFIRFYFSYYSHAIDNNVKKKKKNPVRNAHLPVLYIPVLQITHYPCNISAIVYSDVGPCVRICTVNGRIISNTKKQKECPARRRKKKKTLIFIIIFSSSSLLVFFTAEKLVFVTNVDFNWQQPKHARIDSNASVNQYCTREDSVYAHAR